MSARFVATVGNGRLLARIGADGSLIRLCAPHLDAELLEKPAHAVLEVGAERRRRIGGRGWKHRREYVRGTNVLRVMSRHSTGIKVERRLAAIADLYARSVLVIAQHHDRSGSFAADGGEDVLVAHALDACGERGAARAFFEWALEHDRGDPQFAWGLEQHLRRSHSPELATRLAELQANGGVEPPSSPAAGTSAALWAAWQDTIAGRRANAVAALQGAAARRSSLRLFVSGGGVDLAAHALLLLTVHAGMPEPRAAVLVAEVRSDLDVSGVTIEVAGLPPEHLEAIAEEPGRTTRWRGPVPATEAGEVSRYKIRVNLRDAEATPVWASDSDPRPGGQEFAYESAPPSPPEWVRDA